MKDMKKWLIPVAGLAVVAIIAVLTNHFVLHKQTEAGTYKIYMIAIGDKGKQGKQIGCGDSLVTINRQTVRPNHIQDVYQDVVGEAEYDYSDTLKNPVAESKLNVDSAMVDSDGVARVFLSGDFSVSNKCDGDRVQAQLEQPAYQFDGVKKVQVFINNIALPTVIAQKTGQ